MTDSTQSPDLRRTPTHEPPSPQERGEFDVCVVGGGHAGIEAALAAARLGAAVALVSFRLDKIGEMSCNPAIGGLGKGQIVREIDALGGAMARIADATGIQFRMLNTGKGHAVRGPRCQSDRHQYRERAYAEVCAADGVTSVEAGAVGLILENSSSGVPTVRGIRLDRDVPGRGSELRASAVILTTGTFLRAVMHTGEVTSEGGRVGEASAFGMSDDLDRLGLELGRLKTGTPPRLQSDGIDWSRLEAQGGDSSPTPFAHVPARPFPALPQVECHITWTNERTHEIIRANLHRAPMYSGRIQGVGPRYCPSVEDKVVRFADRDRHQVFLEPEGLDTDVIYVNGVSTSLPAEVQEEFVHTVEGLEHARFLRHGYAVEYDFVMPSQLDDTLAVRKARGLWLAGQINGTSGYEEAAGQGLVAGANAALWCRSDAPFALGRHEAYIGVMVDDLTVSAPTEPYRMFSSRAEYRLLLRHDNADRRLMPLAKEIGLIGDEPFRAFEERRTAIEETTALLNRMRGEGGKTLAEILRRPAMNFGKLAAAYPVLADLELTDELRESIEVDVKYEGYVKRQWDDVERLRRQEATEIPEGFDVEGMTGMAREAREKIAKLRPRTLGAASRIEGVRPPDVALLAVHLKRHRGPER